jgi:hypothetical protein
MGGSEPIALLEQFCAWFRSFRLGAHRVRTGADDDSDSRSTSVPYGGQHVRQHRLPCDLMQDFGARRAHPGSFAGGENDRKTSPLAHQVSNCHFAAWSYPGLGIAEKAATQDMPNGAARMIGFC